MPKPRRKERLESLFQQEISRIIQQEIKDPRLTGLVSVTKVEIAPDMRTANVHVSVYTLANLEKNREKDLEALESAKSYIMFKLSKAVDIKYIPELAFHLDTSMEKADRVAQLLKKGKNENEKTPPIPAASPADGPASQEP
jgi:ribosome-binding factor A